MIRTTIVVFAVAVLGLLTLAGVSRRKPRRVPWRGRML